MPAHWTKVYGLGANVKKKSVEAGFIGTGHKSDKRSAGLNPNAWAILTMLLSVGFLFPLSLSLTDVKSIHISKANFS